MYFSHYVALQKAAYRSVSNVHKLDSDVFASNRTTFLPYRVAMYLMAKS